MNAVVAQLDRAMGFYPIGSRFESWRRCQSAEKCITYALHGAGKCIHTCTQSAEKCTYKYTCVHKDAIFGHWRIHIHGDAHQAGLLQTTPRTLSPRRTTL